MQATYWEGGGLCSTKKCFSYEISTNRYFSHLPLSDKFLRTALFILSSFKPGSCQLARDPQTEFRVSSVLKTYNNIENFNFHYIGSNTFP